MRNAWAFFIYWLPGLVSQGALLWDGMRLRMERIIKGQYENNCEGEPATTGIMV